MNKLETALARNAHKKRAYAFLATLQKAVPFKNPILLAGFEDADKLHDMISFDGSIDDADPVFSLDVACAQFQDTPFAKLPEDQCYKHSLVHNFQV